MHWLAARRVDALGMGGRTKAVSCRVWRQTCQRQGGVALWRVPVAEARGRRRVSEGSWWQPVARVAGAAYG